MDEDLRELFLAKGLTEDVVASMQAGDDSLCSVGDLASGAASEADARNWADELGLGSRVQKSRFVQSWLEARVRLQMSLQTSVEVHAQEALMPASVAALPQTNGPADTRGLEGFRPTPGLEVEWAGRMSLQTTSTAHTQGLESFGPPPVIQAPARASPPGRFSQAAIATLGAAAAAVGGGRAARPARSRPSFSSTLAGELGGLPRTPAVGSASPPRRTAEPVAALPRRRRPVLPEAGAPETFSREGKYLLGCAKASSRGLSDQLVDLLKSCGLTCLELMFVEEGMELRTCRELGEAATNWDEALRLAQKAGIHSKVSQENFARAWRAYTLTSADKDSEESDLDDLRDGGVGGGRAGEGGGGGPSDYPLFTLMVLGDFDACADYMARRSNLRCREDLMPMVRSLLAHIAAKQQGPELEKVGADRQVLSKLAAAYGLGRAEAEELLSDVQKGAEVEKAEWRWKWTLRTLFDARTALALQRRLLEEYRSTPFRVACAKLGGEWAERARAPELEEKITDIEVLCLEHVLCRVLPEFGFSPNQAGIKEMKASITTHVRTEPEVRKLQVEISSAVMDGLKL